MSDNNEVKIIDTNGKVLREGTSPYTITVNELTMN